MIGEDGLVQQLLNELPLLKDFQEVKKIDKGFSHDEKYFVLMKHSDEKFLVRFFPIEEIDERLREFNLIKEIGIHSPKTIQGKNYGVIRGKGYMITNYVEGVDAEEILPTLSEETQYSIGYEAGQELLKIHQVQAPEHIENWGERKQRKHLRYLEAYRHCGFKLKHDEKLIQFISDHLHLMENRPNVFLHDDYHPCNLIVQNGVFNGVIDFGRYDWGDPIHEFLKTGQFSRNISIPFSIGLIQGYSQGKEPSEEFWTLYSLYLAMSIFSGIVWSLKVAPDTFESMLDKINLLLLDHHYFDEVKPEWYKV